MRLHLWGTDFHRMSTELRRALFVEPEGRAEKLKELISLGFQDMVYLPTCNRVEFFTTASDPFADTSALWKKLLQHFGLPESAYYQGYHLEGKAALRHLMRVASSLESMVVGEPQILGQLKESVQFSRSIGVTLETSLERAFQSAFEAAKRVRTETAISEKSVSVATLGIQHLVAMEADWPMTKAVVVGRSPMCTAIVQWLKKNRPQCKILWVNRSLEKLLAMPEALGVETQSLAELLRQPTHFSHLITATSSSEALFGTEFFEQLVPARRVVLDLAHPGDLSPEVKASQHLEIVAIESLRMEADENSKLRTREVASAETLIEESLRNYCLQQKEAPLLKEFSLVEERLMEEAKALLGAALSTFPEGFEPALRKLIEAQAKRNAHISREHLRELLRRVTEPSEVAPPLLLAVDV